MTKILVIEDETNIRENIVDLLESEEFEAVSAPNGNIGVQVAKAEHPDLILCDVMMPELDGYGVLMELRADPDTALIPFIFLTAKADRNDLRQGMNLGADDYLTKPCTPDELLNAIASRLSRASKQIEKLKALSEQLEKLEIIDSLTGLPNEAALEGEGGLFEKARANFDKKHQILPFLTLGLDRFSRINDSIGYYQGNIIIKTLGERLRDFTQKLPGSAIVRLSGDEFAIILPPVKQQINAVEEAEKLLKIVAKPLEVANQTMLLTASIGITFYPQAFNLEEMRRQAGVAMGEAKREGRNRCKIYTRPLFEETTSKELHLAAEIHQAWEQKFLKIFYQSTVDIRKNKIVGVAAVLYWEHPRLGVIPSHQLEALVKEAGLSAVLGEWILQLACQQMKLWQSAKIAVPQVSVTIPESLFLSTNFPNILLKILQDTGVKPECLELEIPAETFVQEQQINTLAAKLMMLQKWGIKTTISQFGISHTSLTYLKDLALNAVKLDSNLMLNLAQNMPMVSAIIQIGHNLKLKVIADGVETDVQESLLKKNKCDGYQRNASISEPEVRRLFGRRWF